MAEANFIEEGMDRIEDAFRSIEKDFRRLQKRADKRRKQFEKQAEKRVKQLQADIRNNRVVKRAEDLRGDAVKAVEEQVDALLGQVRDVMDKAALAVQAVFIFTLLAGLTVLWLAGKIFRIGILRSGQPPKIIELVRWLRS